MFLGGVFVAKIVWKAHQLGEKFWVATFEGER